MLRGFFENVFDPYIGVMSRAQSGPGFGWLQEESGYRKINDKVLASTFRHTIRTGIAGAGTLGGWYGLEVMQDYFGGETLESAMETNQSMFFDSEFVLPALVGGLVLRFLLKVNKEHTLASHI